LGLTLTALFISSLNIHVYSSAVPTPGTRHCGSTSSQTLNQLTT